MEVSGRPLFSSETERANNNNPWIAWTLLNHTSKNLMMRSWFVLFSENFRYIMVPTLRKRNKALSLLHTFASASAVLSHPVAPAPVSSAFSARLLGIRRFWTTRPAPCIRGGPKPWSDRSGVLSLGQLHSCSFVFPAEKLFRFNDTVIFLFQFK